MYCWTTPKGELLEAKTFMQLILKYCLLGFARRIHAWRMMRVLRKTC